MKKYILFLTVTIFLITACEGYDWNRTDEDECDYPDYSDCITQEPFRDSLNIELTVNEQYKKVKLTVYEGDVETGIMVTQFESEQSEIKIPVLIDVKYSATALYISDNDTILAADGSEIKKRSVAYCDSTCWTVWSRNIDLRLAIDD